MRRITVELKEKGLLAITITLNEQSKLVEGRLYRLPYPGYAAVSPALNVCAFGEQPAAACSLLAGKGAQELERRLITSARGRFVAVAPTLVALSRADHKRADSGEFNLLGEDYFPEIVLPEASPTSDEQARQWERETMGYAITPHREQWRLDLLFLLHQYQEQYPSPPRRDNGVW